MRSGILMANPYQAPQEIDRRKRAAAIAAGAVVGAAAATGISAFLTMVGDIALVGGAGVLGAIVGGALGDAMASRLDLGPWEPVSAGRGYVGTHAPDDPGGL
jgi:hypothetical protein